MSIDSRSSPASQKTGTAAQRIAPPAAIEEYADRLAATDAADGPRQFNGLIQHSFALRMHDSHASCHGTSVAEMVKSCFGWPDGASGGFQVRPLGEPLSKSETAPHSVLVNKGLTTLQPFDVQCLKQSAGSYAQELPKAFSWAGSDGAEEHWQRFILGRREPNEAISRNDFLVAPDPSGPYGEEAPDCRQVSQVLGELLAHRRSMLFGMSLGNRFVNVMLPHALLAPDCEGPEDGRAEGARVLPPGPWLLQPLLSLIRVRRDGGEFRRTYSLTFFLIPITAPGLAAREMSEWEIRNTVVRAGWTLASAPWPPRFPRFFASGPLLSYISSITPSVEGELALLAQERQDGAPRSWKPMTLRQVVESIAFAIALRMTQGTDGTATTEVRREVGDDVVASLSTSRVSSALLVDEHLAEEAPRGWPPDPVFPGSLESLMSTLVGSTRIASRIKYRLDRPFFDYAGYAGGVLPSSRCIVVTSSQRAQAGRLESGLMQMGWLAYMTIGAAAAIGTMRAIYRDLERTECSQPSEIARIERDVVVDLHEIYDLDITWEAYRRRYRVLRSRLGITADYQALHGKLEALYRETAAAFDARTQKRLEDLTAAIVKLSKLILVVGIVAVIVAIVAIVIPFVVK